MQKKTLYFWLFTWLVACDDGAQSAPDASADASAVADTALPDAALADAALADAALADAALPDAALVDTALPDATLPDAEPLPVAEVEALVTPWVEAGWLPSVSIALIRGPDVAFLGLGALDDGRAPDPDTAYEIGSISKTFTGLLLAQAVEAGEVDLDDPVADLLPEGTVVPTFEGTEITLQHLVTHHSGLPRDATNAPFADEPDRFFAGYSEALLYEFLADYTLPRAPGAAFEYSNIGAGLLGHALTRLAGQTYSDLLRDRITEPLGLATTGIGLATPNLAAPHHEDGRPALPIELGVLAGAGALQSTARDLATYLQAHLDPDETPLPNALRAAHTPLADITPAISIGHHWIIESDLIWHNGATYGSGSFSGFDPTTGLGIVFLTNTAGYLTDPLPRTALDLMRGLPVRPRTPPATIELTADQRAPLQGTFRAGLGTFVHIFSENDGLYLRVDDQPLQIALFAESPTELHVRRFPGHLSFEAGDPAPAFVFDDGTQQTRFRRTE